MNKSKAIFASVALVAVAMAPLALAHNNPTDWALQPVLTPDKKTNDANRVSGVYYKDVSLLVGHNGPVVADNDTSFQLGVANALCDMEVLSDGTASGSALDETEVDDAATPTSAAHPNAAGTNPLTLFDDGGVGAVCHTHSHYYAYEPYNTPGCEYADAFGADQVSARVWLTTVCDYGYATSGVGLATYVLACANNLLTSDVGGLVTCVTNLLACFTTSGANCPLDAGLACGADDAGSGGVQTPGKSGWSNVGVAFESVPSPCADADGAAAVFVWTAVFVDTTASPLPTVAVSAPTVGVIY